MKEKKNLSSPLQMCESETCSHLPLFLLLLFQPLSSQPPASPYPASPCPVSPPLWTLWGECGRLSSPLLGDQSRSRPAESKVRCQIQMLGFWIYLISLLCEFHKKCEPVKSCTNLKLVLIRKVGCKIQIGCKIISSTAGSFCSLVDLYLLYSPGSEQYILKFLFFRIYMNLK